MTLTFTCYVISIANKSSNSDLHLGPYSITSLHLIRLILSLNGYGWLSMYFFLQFPNGNACILPSFKLVNIPTLCSDLHVLSSLLTNLHFTLVEEQREIWVR